MFLIQNKKTKLYFKRENAFGSGCLRLFTKKGYAYECLDRQENKDDLCIVDYMDKVDELYSMYGFLWSSNREIAPEENEMYYILDTSNGLAYSDAINRFGVDDFKFGLTGCAIHTKEEAEEILETLYGNPDSWVAREKLKLKIVKSDKLREEGYRGIIIWKDKVEDPDGNIHIKGDSTWRGELI